MDQRDRLSYIGHLQQLGGTRLVTLEEGAERGVRAVEFRTTTGLDLAVLVDRGFDVGWCRYQGRSIAWHAPTGFAGPWYREPDGLGFLRTFGGGLFTTSGLDHILFPEADKHDTYNYPGRQQTEYGLHGRVANTPGVLRAHGATWRDGACTLYAEGEVRQAGALAEHLVLRRRVSTALDGRTVVWEDEVTNEGWYPTPHMLLYHVNLGAPLLDASCELLAPIEEVGFSTPTATGGPGEHLRFHEPRQGFLEQAFLHRMKPAADGRVTVALLNHADPEHPWGVALRYSSDGFPYFFQWRYLDAGNYVLGLEPSTNSLAGRSAAREQGELRQLQPGESVRYRTELEVLDGPAACAAARVEAGAA